MSRVSLVLILLGLSFIAGRFYGDNPSLATCIPKAILSLAFWITWYFIFCQSHRLCQVAGLLAIIGALMKNIVLIANNGLMPNPAITEGRFTVGGNLAFLGDYYGGWSIGDFFLFTAFTLVFIGCLFLLAAKVKEPRI